MNAALERRISRLESAVPPSSAGFADEVHNLIRERVALLAEKYCSDTAKVRLAMVDAGLVAIDQRLAEIPPAPMSDLDRRRGAERIQAELTRFDAVVAAARVREAERQAGLRAYRAPEARQAEQVPLPPWGAGDPEIDERVPYTVKAAARRQGQKPWWC